MKKTILAITIAFVALATGLQASSSSSGSSGTGTGIGLVFGYPGNVGISVKIKNFPVLGISWSLGKSSYFGGTIDYWFINSSLGSDFYWFLAGGAYVWLGNNIGRSSTFGLGVCVPIGLQWFPASGPFEIFIEAAPALDILPSLGGNFTDQLGFIIGRIGVRYHF